ncbi:MAG: hypothetical protein ACRC5H_05055 [Treponemataceae bacterium]
MIFAKKFIILFIVSLLPSTFFAFETILSIQDSSDIREKIFPTWLSISVPELLEKSEEFHYNKEGQIFKVSRIDYGPEVALTIVPRQKDSSFDQKAAGSWHLYRDKLTGEITKIMYFFQAENEVFVQIRKGSTKNFADMIIFGAYAAHNVPIGITMNSLVTKSFSFFYQLTKSTLPWDYVQITRHDYFSIIQMINAVRENLYLFEFIDDAAYDKASYPIHLSDHTPRTDAPSRLGVNSKGFLKWLVDGLILPITGKNTEVLQLIYKESDIQQIQDISQTNSDKEKNDALKWTRSLATETLLSTSQRIQVQNTHIDVRSNFFSRFTNEEGKFKGSISYVEDVGYHADIILPLMYVLAAKEPNSFFLASLKKNVEDTQEFPYSEDTTSFFPYFDSQGHFQLVIFKNGTEVSFEDFFQANKNNFIHFTRIKAGERFIPITPYIMMLQANKR